MNDTTLVDRVMDSLAFEVEAVPHEDGKISSASNSSPLKVKIKIRKKNRNHFLSGGIISIPKINRAIYSSEKLRLSSSDQTIMSFDVFMERGESATKPLPRQKRILQLFKRGGCLGIQNDEDRYEYSIGTSKKTNQENSLLEQMKSFSNETLCKLNYTLAKNYSTIEASPGNKSKPKDFLGKCKPGGCLDPPFNEEKYSYLPKLIVPESEKSITKMKQNEPEYNKEIKNESTTKFPGIDFTNAGVKKEKSRSLLSNNIFLMPTKDSNSIITFPSISPSREALEKLNIQKRSKSFSSSKESRSYNDSNQQLETYYISPKIKTINKTLKSVIDSCTHLDSKDPDDPTVQSHEQLLYESKLEAQTLPMFLTKISESIQNIESTHDSNANLQLEANNHDVKIENLLLDVTCEEIIPNDTKNNLILSSKSKSIASLLSSISSAMLLPEQHENFYPEIITRSEKDKSTSVKIFPEIKSNTEIIISGEDEFDSNTIDSKQLEEDLNNKKTDSKAAHSFGVQKVACRENLPSNYNNNQFHSPPTTSSVEGVLYLPKKTEDAIPSELNNYEEIVVAPLNHYFDVHYSQKRETSPEIQLEEKSGRITEKVSSSDNTILNYKNSIEKIITPPQDLTLNNENLKTTDTAAEPSHLKERDKPVICVTNITKSAEVEENRAEMINTSPADHTFSQETLETMDTTDHFHAKESSQPIKNVSEHISDSSVIKSDEKVIAQAKDSFKDGHVKIIDKDVEINQEMDKSITEIMSITQKFDEDEIPIVLQYSSLDKDDLKGGIISKVYSQDSDQFNLNKMSITKSSKENVLEDFERYENIIEDPVGNNKTSSDSAGDVFSAEKLISDAVKSISLNSEKVKEIEQILKYSDQDFRDSFIQKEEDTSRVEVYSVRRDVVSTNTDKDILQDNSEFPFLVGTDISLEKKLHEVNSVISNTVHESSSTAKLQNIKNTIVPKIDSTQDKIKDEKIREVPEATSDNTMSKSTELSDINTLNKPIDKKDSQINVKMNNELNLSSDIPRILKKSSSYNVHKTPTIPFNNGAVRKKEDRNLKDATSKNNIDKEIIHLDFAFQSFYTDNDESVIKTLEFRSISEIKRYPNDNVLQFKTVIIPNEGLIKIPIDTDKDLLLQIKTDQQIKSQDDESIKSLPERNKKLDLIHKSSLLSKDDKRGIKFSSIHPVTNNIGLRTLTKSVHDPINISDSSLEQTLDSVYKEKLLPLHKVIKKLKDDIEGLTNQQTLVKDKLNKAKGFHSNRIQMAGKNCCCIDMPFK